MARPLKTSLTRSSAVVGATLGGTLGEVKGRRVLECAGEILVGLFNGEVYTIGVVIIWDGGEDKVGARFGDPDALKTVNRFVRRG